MGLLTIHTVKKLNFNNPTWWTAAILKTVKLPYICNHLIDFDEIWHADAEPVSSPHHLLKVHNFKIKDG